MTVWNRLARLRLNDWALLLAAGFLLMLVRLSLWILPWTSIVAMLRRMRFPLPAELSPERAEWAVRNAGRLFPLATCLTDSLTLQYLLNRSGHPCRLQLGVVNSPKGFEAHAWVEHNGEPLLNTPAELERYSRLLSLERL